MREARSAIAGDRIDAIQYLRGIAAMLVVLHHVRNPRPWMDWNPLAGSDFGASGVAVFFVISGFVMYHACRDEPAGRFLLRRAIRIVPLYWIMTTVRFAILARDDLANLSLPALTGDYLRSLLFIPHYHAVHTDRIWPVLIPGWTLTYETFFFAVFAVGILTRRTVVVTATALAFLVGLGVFYHGRAPLVLTWTSPFLLLFLAGIGIGVLRRRGVLDRLRPALAPAAFLFVLSGLGVFGPALDPAMTAISSVMLVAGVAAPGSGGAWPLTGLLGRLGDASYSIYLSHAVCLGAVMAVLARVPLTGPAQFLAVTSAALVICAGIGIATWRLVERPLLRRMRRREMPALQAGLTA